MKRTKIVCTIGPASENLEILEQMILSGMDIARLNFSHGSYENHAQLIQNIRSVSKKLEKPIMILQDLQGPKIRIGTVPKEGISLKKDEEYVFDTALLEYTSGGAIPIDYAELHTNVQVGERVLFADGIFEGVIQSVNGTQITVKMTVAGQLFPHKGLNVPDSKLTIRALTQKDKEDAWFGVEQGVDMIAASFVSSKKDIEELRAHIEAGEKKLNISSKTPIGILAKIERAAALDHIDEIFDSVDAIMVARGDLGVETPAAEVPIVQKKLIQKALSLSKPIIVATQMLDSMVDAPRATRAEVSDVANAVIDHTDGVMLSNESATGHYPIQAVQTLSDTIIATENSEFDQLKKQSVTAQMQLLREYIKKQPEVHAIFMTAQTGEVVREMSSQRFEFPIFVAVDDERLLRQLQLSWGVFPVFVQKIRTVEENFQECANVLQKNQWKNVKKSIVLVSSECVYTQIVLQ